VRFASWSTSSRPIGSPVDPDGVYPDPFKTPLSECGRREGERCRAAVRRYRPDVVLASDFAPALETARIATGGDHEIQVETALRERVMYSLVGRTFTEIAFDAYFAKRAFA
jgi:broad specificity phosphatase PhoE